MYIGGAENLCDSMGHLWYPSGEAILPRLDKWRTIMKSTIQCQLCDKEWRENQVIPLENVPDLLQRIDPGEVVPFGECPDPECGGLCHQEHTSRLQYVQTPELRFLRRLAVDREIEARALRTYVDLLEKASSWSSNPIAALREKSTCL